MATVFADIVSGKIPAHRAAENERCLAFMERKPVNPGHTLVIPKNEVDYLFDLSDAELAELMIFAKRVARALRAVVPCKKIGLMVAGIEVPHAHIHLIPIHNTAKELNFEKAREATDADLKAMARAIRKAFGV